MILPINETTRIKSDHYCWTVEQRKRRKKDGEWSRWVAQLHYPALKQTLNGLVQLSVRTCEATSFDEAISYAKDTATLLSRALTKAGEVGDT